MTGLRKEIGTAPTEFHGYLSASEENVIILSGLTMPYGRVDTMAESVDSEADIIQNAMKATTQVRTANVSDVFRKPVIDTTTQTTNEPKMLGMAALADLKARRISK